MNTQDKIQCKEYNECKKCRRQEGTGHSLVCCPVKARARMCRHQEAVAKAKKHINNHSLLFINARRLQRVRKGD